MQKGGAPWQAVEGNQRANGRRSFSSKKEGAERKTCGQVYAPHKKRAKFQTWAEWDTEGGGRT